jgi:hypothetical protein
MTASSRRPAITATAFTAHYRFGLLSEKTIGSADLRLFVCLLHIDAQFR